jgi:hypothetical protein
LGEEPENLYCPPHLVEYVICEFSLVGVRLPPHARCTVRYGFVQLSAANLAWARHVSADEFLGLAPLRDTPSPKVAPLLKCVERLADLPEAEQRDVLKVVDGFLDSFSPAKPRRAAPSPRPGRKSSYAPSEE